MRTNNEHYSLQLSGGHKEKCCVSEYTHLVAYALHFLHAMLETVTFSLVSDKDVS